MTENFNPKLEWCRLYSIDEIECPKIESIILLEEIRERGTAAVVHTATGDRKTMTGFVVLPTPENPSRNTMGFVVVVVVLQSRPVEFSLQIQPEIWREFFYFVNATNHRK